MKRVLLSAALFAGLLGLGTGTSLAQQLPPIEDTSVSTSADCQTYWPSPYQVCGPIRDLYTSLGGPTGTLGFPKSAEVLDPDGIGKQSEFFGGTIRWTPSTGAYVV
ncbi:LGFP repeat-containing protein [Rhodococcus erythropolis]|uniref:LGFP repeat-containing protein n=1 Tax=Rhodococcus erythropolis TaxID=1833 RepID=UPI0037B5AB5B